MDRQLMILFQKEIPLKPRPFEILGKGIGIHSADLMLRLNRLQEEGHLGRISAVFDAEKVGYQRFLAVFHVPKEYEDQASYYILEHPGVTHCVKRKGRLNFWFSMTLPAEESLEFHLGSLKGLSKAQQFFILKTRKIFKPSGSRTTPQNPKGKTAGVSGDSADVLTPLERKLIRVMQEEFPLSDYPYRDIAKEIGSSEELVLKQLQFFQKKGLLKKIGIFPPGASRKTTGALLLWNLPEEKAAGACEAIAEFPEVNFCAERFSREELPFNVHVLTEDIAEEKVAEVTDKIERRIGMWPRLVLLKEKEEKRGEIKFFSKDIEDWRLLHEGQAASFFSV